jgi:hypothetical protein
MADELDVPSFGNFGIENTYMGSAELLNDLLAPETATGNPDDIEKIVKETPPPVITPDEKQRGKEIVPKKEGEEPTDQDILKNFLGDSTENDNNEPTPSPIPTIEEPEKEVSQFTALSKDLYKLGVFTKEEGDEDVEISTPEEFLEKFNAEKKKGAIEVVNNFISQFGEDYQNAFEAIYVKGVNPKEYFNTYNTITDFASLDLTNEDNQIRVIRQALTDQGLDPQDINDEIDQVKNYGDLESKATKYHKVLVKKEALKLQQMEQKAEYELQQKANIKNQYVQNVQQVIQEKLKLKEFDGIPINSNLANELQDFLLVDKYKTATGETLTDFDKTVLELKRPENHAMKVKVALLLKILEKDPTLSTIQKSGITKKSDQLFGEIARQKVVSKSPSQQKPIQWSL